MATEKRHNNKKKKIKKKYGKLDVKRFAIVGVSACLVLYCVYILIWQQVTISRKNNEIDELQTQIDMATEENERLQAELENIDDPETIERMAREKLGLVRPNERVFADANQGD